MSVDALRLLEFRVDELRKEVSVNTAWRQSTSEMLAGRAVEYSNLNENVKALTADVAGLRRVLIGMSCSIAGSAVVFGLSILIATGKI